MKVVGHIILPLNFGVLRVIFLWLTLNNKLLINEVRMIRGISETTSCIWCNYDVEDSLLTLCDCLRPSPYGFQLLSLAFSWDFSTMNSSLSVIWISMKRWGSMMDLRKSFLLLSVGLYRNDTMQSLWQLQL